MGNGGESYAMLAGETYDDLDRNEFVSPSAPYRLQPWWFWNGEMDPELMRWQIGEMHQKGCGGFYVTPRQGLAIPYQSKEYFDRFRLALQEATDRGMLVGIMDDFPYPSGMAGGETTWRYPGFIRAQLRAVDFVATGPQRISRTLGTGEVLRAWAFPIRDDRVCWDERTELRQSVGVSHACTGLHWGESLTSYSYARFGGYLPENELVWQVPEGDWRVMIFIVDRVRSFKYYGEFLDTCNPQAVEHFLNLTIGRHQQALGEPLGRRLRSIFTDETTAGNWTWQMPHLFEQRCGYNLLDRLPHLIADVGPESPRVRYDYLATLHDLFMEAYHLQYARRCEGNGCLYTTEVPMLRNADQGVVHVPGVDHAHERIGEELNHGWQTRDITSFRSWPKFAASVAAQRGKPRVAVEAFHSLGWGVRIADLKALIDRMAALGVNLFALHGFYYTAGGPAKFDAAPSEFYQHPWWEHFRKLADYAARLAYVASRGQYVAPIAVLDPIPSNWTTGADEWSVLRQLGLNADIGDRLKDDWSWVYETLTAAQRDFHSLDPQDLASGSVEDKQLVVGEARYQALIIPPIASLERAAFEQIRSFAETGGVVLWLGLLPFQHIDEASTVVADAAAMFNVDAATVADEYLYGELAKPQWLTHGRTRFLAAPGGLRRCQADKILLDGLAELLPPGLEFDLPSRWRDHILVHQRRVEGRDIFLMANCSPQQLATQVHLPTDAAAVQHWDAESGECIAVDAHRNGERLTAPVVLPPHGTAILITSERADATPRRTEEPVVLKLDLTSTWSVAQMPRNFLRLGKFKVRLGEHPDQPEIDDGPSIPPEPIINTISRLSLREPVPIEIKPGFWAPSGFAVSYPLVVTYRARFCAEHIPDDLRLVADRHGLAGSAQIFLNGHRLPLEEFETDFVFDYSNISLPISGYAQKGENSISVVMEVEADDEGLVDALWLAGSFGVTPLSDSLRTIVEPPEQVCPLELADCGLPHFAGTLSLKCCVNLTTNYTHLGLATEGNQFIECAQLLLNGEDLGVRCWPPYRWVIPEDLRRMGEAAVTLKITTSAGPVIEGRIYDHQTDEYREV